MKTKILLLSLVLTFIATGFIYGQTQDEPQLYLVEEFRIKPSGVAEFRNVIQEMFKEFERNNFSFQIQTYSTSDQRFFLLFPLKDYADLGNAYSEVGKIAEQVGAEKWNELHQREYEQTQSVKLSLYHYMPGLSFLPENPRLKPEEATYIFMNWVYMKYDRLGELDDILKEWKALYAKYGITDPFSTWKANVGPDYNLTILIWSAKNAIDFHEMNNNIWETIGDEGVALYQRTMELVERMEQVEGRYRPGMSYTPDSLSK